MKVSPLSATLLASGILLGLATLSQAAVLANYTFNDPSTSTAKSTSDDTDPNSTASTFTITNGATAGTGSGISASTDMAFFRSDGLTTTEAGAIAAPDYFAFTFTPNVGTSFNLTSITLDLGGSNGGATGGPAGGPSNAFTSFAVLRSTAEATDYSTNIGGTASQVVPGPGDAGTSILGLQTFNLTGPEFTNVTAPITFRLYVYTSDNTFANQILRVDNVVLNGVPEPGSMALALGGLGASLLFRRRVR